MTPSTAQATQSYNPLSKEMVQVLNNVDKQTFTAPTGVTPDAIYLTKKYLKDFSDKKINKNQLMKLLQTIDKNKNNLEMPKEFKQ
jgi:mRNA-degrading endonuclease HigB of HigAB toxin-antitoxin module